MLCKVCLSLGDGRMFSYRNDICDNCITVEDFKEKTA